MRRLTVWIEFHDVEPGVSIGDRCGGHDAPQGDVGPGVHRLLLERIDAVNPALNAVVELRREAALQAASAADQALATGASGRCMASR